MKILSIETCSKICAVAILEDLNVIKEISLDNGLTHSQTLMPLVNQIFEETNLKLSDIDLLVCDVGPGSFTGIRIGVATIKAFVDSLGIDAVGISSLHALALNSKEDGVICSLIDARKENVYNSVFEIKNGNYEIKSDPYFETLDDLLLKLKKYNTNNLTFVGDGAIKYKDKILSVFPTCTFLENNDLSAVNVGIAGYRAYKSNNYSGVEPLYIRKSEAEVKLEEKQNGNK